MKANILGLPAQAANETGVQTFVTVEPVRAKQNAISVESYQFVEISVASDAVEANSDVDTIVATAHAAVVGDVIRFTSGALSGASARVVSIPDANTIQLAERLTAAPAVADTFQILRHRQPTVAADGSVNVTAGPIQFTRDGANQTVIEDTVVPANNRPLPVKLTGVSGDVSINAANLNLDVQLTDQGANADVVRIGDGTDQLGIYVEDAASGGGETGPVVLAVRNSANAVLTSADGDYGTLTVDDTGRLRVDATIVEAGTFAEDSASVGGETGKFVLGVRNDASAVLTSADGDFSALAVDSAGRQKSVVESVIPGTGATNLGKAEDSVHASGDVGVMPLAVRQDATAAMAADGDYTPLQTDANGFLKVAATVTESAVYAEDSGHVSGDNLKAMGAVRNDASAVLTSADLDYSPVAVDSSGRIKNVVESVVPGTGASNLGKAEDAVHASGDVGVMPLAVRQDATAAMAADGDYTPLQTDANGYLKVSATVTESAVYAEDSGHVSGDNLKAMGAVRNDASATLTSADLDYSPVAVDLAGRIKNVVESVIPGTGATNLGKAESSAHASGDTGVMSLAVRSDATGALAADGQYSPLQTDANGYLKVASSESAVYAEDSSHVSGDNLKAIAAVRNDAGIALAGTDLDYIPLTTDANGYLWVKPGSQAGRTVVNTIRNDYSVTSVTTGAWVQLLAATAATANEIEIFDSSGQTLELGTGAAAAETRLLIIFPGGNGRVPVTIPAGTRLSARAISANATVGEIDINIYS